MAPIRVNQNLNFYGVITEGLLVKFLYDDPPDVAITWNVRRLILLNQEKAIALYREKLRYYGEENLQIPTFKEAEIKDWEGQPVNGRSLIMYLRKRTNPFNNSKDSTLELYLCAITDVQNTRPLAGKVGRCYLNILEGIFSSYPESEFIWRPQIAGETNHQYGLWLQRRPKIVLGMHIAELDTTMFGETQLAGQPALTLAMNITAGINVS